MAESIFKTERKEGLKSRMRRIAFNFFPAYRRTGGRIYFLSDDWKEIHVKLGLNWTTKNYVGSVFGGSIFGALDPIYMVQLINILGKEYVVWDKSASIKFIKPVKGKVFAKFLIMEEVLNEIKMKVALEKKHTINLTASFQDRNGKVYEEINKEIYIAEKAWFKTKKEGIEIA